VESAERPGDSGVATYFRKSDIDLHRALGFEEFDVEGPVIRLNLFDFTLFIFIFRMVNVVMERVD